MAVGLQQTLLQLNSSRYHHQLQPMKQLNSIVQGLTRKSRKGKALETMKHLKTWDEESDKESVPTMTDLSVHRKLLEVVSMHLQIWLQYHLTFLQEACLVQIRL